MSETKNARTTTIAICMLAAVLMISISFDAITMPLIENTLIVKIITGILGCGFLFMMFMNMKKQVEENHAQTQSPVRQPETEISKK